MKSDIDIKDDVYKVIHGSVLEKSVTGVLKRTKRPLNSECEDIVISIRSNKLGTKQEAFVDVNIYVQDENVKGQDEEKSYRLRNLCQLCMIFFEKIHGKDFRLSLDEQNVEDVRGEHVINNKLLYQTINN